MYNLFVNLQAAVVARGAIIESAPISTEQEFALEMRTRSYVKIKANRAAHPVLGAARVYAYLFSPESSYISTKGKLEDFIKKTVAADFKDDNQYEILLVAYKYRSVKSALATFLSGLPKIYPTARIHVLPDTLFVHNLLEHVLVPTHTPMTDAEIDVLCNGSGFEPKSFPTILASDPVAVWIGLRPGMMVRIDRVSENSCISVGYRLCK